MTREQELETELAALRAELNQTAPPLIRVDGKPARIVYTKEIGRGKYKLGVASLRPVAERQEKIPVIVVEVK